LLINEDEEGMNDLDPLEYNKVIPICRKEDGKETELRERLQKRKKETGQNNYRQLSSG
jgi:hypothetical protein